MSEATVQATYRRYWRCEAVVRGAMAIEHCKPDLPHRPAWGCGYAWIAPVLSDKDIEYMTSPAGKAIQQAFDRRSL